MRYGESLGRPIPTDTTKILNKALALRIKTMLEKKADDLALEVLAEQMTRAQAEKCMKFEKQSLSAECGAGCWDLFS